MNSVSPILTMAGLLLAQRPSSPDGPHAALCSTQPSGCCAIHASRTCEGCALGLAASAAASSAGAVR